MTISLKFLDDTGEPSEAVARKKQRLTEALQQHETALFGDAVENDENAPNSRTRDWYQKLDEAFAFLMGEGAWLIPDDMKIYDQWAYRALTLRARVFTYKRFYRSASKDLEKMREYVKTKNNLSLPAGFESWEKSVQADYEKAAFSIRPWVERQIKRLHPNKNGGISDVSAFKKRELSGVEEKFKILAVYLGNAGYRRSNYRGTQLMDALLGDILDIKKSKKSKKNKSNNAANWVTDVKRSIDQTFLFRTGRLGVGQMTRQESSATNADKWVYTEPAVFCDSLRKQIEFYELALHLLEGERKKGAPSQAWAFCQAKGKQKKELLRNIEPPQKIQLPEDLDPSWSDEFEDPSVLASSHESIVMLTQQFVNKSAGFSGGAVQEPEKQEIEQLLGQVDETFQRLETACHLTDQEKIAMQLQWYVNQCGCVQGSIVEQLLLQRIMQIIKGRGQTQAEGSSLIQSMKEARRLVCSASRTLFDGVNNYWGEVPEKEFPSLLNQLYQAVDLLRIYVDADLAKKGQRLEAAQQRQDAITKRGRQKQQEQQNFDAAVKEKVAKEELVSGFSFLLESISSYFKSGMLHTIVESDVSSIVSKDQPEYPLYLMHVYNFCLENLPESTPQRMEIQSQLRNLRDKALEKLHTFQGYETAALASTHSHCGWICTGEVPEVSVPCHEEETEGEESQEGEGHQAVGPGFGSSKR